MNCDLCNRMHTTDNLLCEVCADMIQRLVVVNSRMHTREVSEAERLRGAVFTGTPNTSISVSQ
jgi:hypothetical protein